MTLNELITSLQEFKLRFPDSENKEVFTCYEEFYIKDISFIDRANISNDKIATPDDLTPEQIENISKHIVIYI